MTVVRFPGAPGTNGFDPFALVAALAEGLPGWLATASAEEREQLGLDLAAMIETSAEAVAELDPTMVIATLQEVLPVWFRSVPIDEIERFTRAGEGFSYAIAALCADRAASMRADFLAGTHNEHGRPI
ncbi:hypothetical protein [Blastochloris tepida]|uniref:Uncharacterized protein n=1 Tax=Blastochloris tepida TaxID=2233851 RepID=A0A348FY35_9HYPH|nr:hypothetical protein [Blastochloris tepida]BBF92218.1 hypothetical protein BLTE_09030 [Blastochloris tepida]